MKTINTTLISLDDSAELKRDPHSKALLSTSINKLEAYREKKRVNLQQQMRIEQCVDDINTLKQEMTDIKVMLTQIINKIN